MKRLLTTLPIIIVALSAASASAREQTILARITAYWPTGSEYPVASSNGARLRAGHCAVDPKKIPYGSKVIFPDTACVAVDCGPAVTSRTAARNSGRTVEQRNALVIDRFFESKRQAMDWVAKNPHFMKVRVLDPHQRIPEVSGKHMEARAGAESAHSKLPKMYSPDGTVLPADAHSPLNPTSFSAALPRS